MRSQPFMLLNTPIETINFCNKILGAPFHAKTWSLLTYCRNSGDQWFLPHALQVSNALYKCSSFSFSFPWWQLILQVINGLDWPNHLNNWHSSCTYLEWELCNKSREYKSLFRCSDPKFHRIRELSQTTS